VLTPKQERFCHEYLALGNASAAYRAAYSTANMKEETVWRNAKTLMDNSKVSTRINELKAPAIEKAELTVEKHLIELAELRDTAKAAGQITAAIRAEELRGKVAGFYTDPLELDSPIRMVVFDD